jgi:tRNA(Ile)-lysidine synthase TilS/MesJ
VPFGIHAFVVNEYNWESSEVKVCNNCVLPETFPAIRFTAEGICQYCLDHDVAGHNEVLRQKYLDKFHALLDKVNTGNAYDAVMAYSGGKDSSYTLKMLKEVYKLEVLAVTFDHGFVSPQALSNIQAVTQALGVDHVMFAPRRDVLYHAFRQSMTTNIYSLKGLQRASSICNTCMNLVKSFLLKTAVEKGIPLIAYGWSPGQAPVQSAVIKLNSSMIEQAQKALVKGLGVIMGDGLKPFVLQDHHFHLLAAGDGTNELSGFYNVHPLAFLAYDEEKIVGEIESLGWRAPQDTDANSTNCLLNGFANQVHLEQYGFHPYAFEIANLVRDGFMSREAGLAKLLEPADQQIVCQVKRKLGVDS